MERFAAGSAIRPVASALRLFEGIKQSVIYLFVYLVVVSQFSQFSDGANKFSTRSKLQMYLELLCISVKL